jgi:hypothetical protein
VKLAWLKMVVFATFEWADDRLGADDLDRSCQEAISMSEDRFADIFFLVEPYKCGFHRQ